MGIVRTEVITSGLVSAESMLCEDFVPPSGEFFIADFISEACFSGLTIVKAVWDATGTPEIIWSSTGSANIKLDIPRTGDGVKKLRLCLENNSTSAVTMSGKLIVVQDV